MTPLAGACLRPLGHLSGALLIGANASIGKGFWSRCGMHPRLIVQERVGNRCLHVSRGGTNLTQRRSRPVHAIGAPYRGFPVRMEQNTAKAILASPGAPLSPETTKAPRSSRNGAKSRVASGGLASVLPDKTVHGFGPPKRTISSSSLLRVSREETNRATASSTNQTTKPVAHAAAT